MSDTSPGLMSSPPAPGSGMRTGFTNEIQQMMYGFGDCSRPLAESATLVEDIVRTQLSCLLFQASEAAALRTGRFISLEDFLFVLRRDKGKLRRLLKFLSLKDMMKVPSSVRAADGDEEATGPEMVSPGPPVRRRVKICHDFLSNIDGTGELLALVDDPAIDDVKLERLARADRRARSLDAQKYREFHEARVVSLHPGHRNKARQQRFREWLTGGIQLEIKPNQLAMEVLGYLANEIVAQIVDLALIVRKDRTRRAEDPIANAMPPIYTNPMTSPAVAAATSPAASLKREPSVTSPNLMSPTMEMTSPPLTSTLNLAGQRKVRKRRKMDGSGLDVSTAAIQPEDIQEVMRRYSHSVGPFAAYEKPAFLAMRHSLLCC